MSEKLMYRLGRGSLTEAKSALKRLLDDLGEVGVYLSEESINDLWLAINELHIINNIKYLKGEAREPASIKIDFFTAYIKSKNKIIVSDKEIEEYKEELL